MTGVCSVLQAVRLVADLCLEYQVYDPQLWKGLLQKLLAFSMVSGEGRRAHYVSLTTVIVLL